MDNVFLEFYDNWERQQGGSDYEKRNQHVAKNTGDRFVNINKTIPFC
jgi:hypothetical protein